MKASPQRDKILQLSLAGFTNINLDRYGNTVAATIPLGLWEWNDGGRFAYGDRIVLSAFGAGFTAGSIYLRWSIV